MERNDRRDGFCHLGLFLISRHLKGEAPAGRDFDAIEAEGKAGAFTTA